MTQDGIPYTTGKMLEMIGQALGIKATRAYINNVIFRDNIKIPPHPLKHAKLDRGMWHREMVDMFCEFQKNKREAAEAEKTNPPD